jgi:hypothetical protein
MANELSVMDQDSLMKLVIKGDLSGLTDTQKMQYYHYRCKALDLDPATKPFDLMVLNGKQVLYATRETGNQLASKRGVSITIVSRQVVNGIYEVQARATTDDGRTTDEIGCVPIEGLKGEDLSNRMMKAVTKAKRRAVLSHCGLGMLDETEVDSIPRQHEQPSSAPEKPKAKPAPKAPPPAEPAPAPALVEAQATVKEAPSASEPPTVVADHPQEAESACFNKFSSKEGQNKQTGKPWTMYGINITLESTGETLWANSFDNALGEVARGMADGDLIMVTLKPGKEFNGKQTWNFSYLAKK